MKAKIRDIRQNVGSLTKGQCFTFVGDYYVYMVTDLHPSVLDPEYYQNYGVSVVAVIIATTGYNERYDNFVGEAMIINIETSRLLLLEQEDPTSFMAVANAGHK